MLTVVSRSESTVAMTRTQSIMQVVKCYPLHQEIGYG